MEEKISVRGKNVYNSSKKIITVSYPIKQFLIVENVIVLLSDIDSKNDKNIVGYDMTGNFKWKVSKVVQIHKHNYFTSIYIEDSNLKAYNVNGVETVIDISNGSIISSELIK